jgi:hypothetical protein
VFTLPECSQFISPPHSGSYSGAMEACLPAAFSGAIASRPLNPITPIPIRTPLQPLPTTTTAPNGHAVKSTSLPTQGLLIPNIPVCLPNGGHSRKDESWRIIVNHWLYGDLPRGLHTALKDWPCEWLQGPNKLFAQKHFDRGVIAREFLEM